MNKTLKLKSVIIFVLAVVMSLFVFASCNVQVGDSPANPTDMAGVYQLAQAYGYTGTYEEFIAEIKGEKGDQGDQGIQGPAGSDGVSITDATVNADGELVITFSTGETVNCGVVKGFDGLTGKSAYEIYLEYHPEYKGSEQEWIDAIATGRLTFEVEATFDVDGGAAVAPVKFNYNDNLLEALSAYTTEKEHYNFLGWTYADGTEIGADDTVPAEGVQVKAAFKGVDVIAIVYRNQSSYNGVRVTLSYGDNLIEALTAAVPYPGYTVESWSHFGGDVIGADETVGFAEGWHYFCANVNENEVVLTFADGGVAYDGAEISNSKDADVDWYLAGEEIDLASFTITGNYGDKSNVELPTPEIYDNQEEEYTAWRYGYRFLGWYTEDGAEWDGTLPEESATIYARWQQNGTLVVMYDTDKTTVVKAYINEIIDDTSAKTYGVINYTAPEGLALEGWKFLGRETNTGNGYVETASKVYMKDTYGCYYNGSVYFGVLTTSRVTDSGERFFHVGNTSALGSDGNVKTAVYKFYASLWDAKYDNCYYEVSNNIAQATGYYEKGTGSNAVVVSTTASEIVIPSTCQDLPVVVQNGSGSSAKQGFDGLGTLTKVHLEAGVTDIGAYAFKDCIALTEVTFEEGTRFNAVGHYAFQNCSALTGLEFPDTLEIVGAYAFQGAFDPEADVTVDFRGAEMIYGGTFYKANGKSLTVKGLKRIPDAIKSYISSGKLYANHYYYYSVTGVRQYYIEEFSNPESSYGYGYATGVPGTSNYGFFEGSTFSTITIGDGTEYVGSAAFRKCIAEDFAVNFADSVTALGAAAFSGSSIKEFDANVTAIPDQAFYQCASLESFSGNNFVSIGADAFYQCTALTSIRVPAGLESIDGSAFAGCTGIRRVVCSADNTHYKYENSFLISLDTKSIVIHADPEATEIVLPEGIVSPGEFFKGNTRITKVTLAKSMTNIDAQAFYGCTSLEEVVFPTYGAGETPTLVEIGEQAFAGKSKTVCNKIETLTIPAYIETIGKEAFVYMANLTEVVFEKGSVLETIPNGAFKYCSKLDTVYLNGKEDKGESRITLIEAYAFSNSTIKTLDFGAAPAKNADGTFTYPLVMQGMLFTGSNVELELPANISSILYNTLQGVAKVSFAEGTQIESLPAAFTYSSNITTFVLPKSVKTIGGGTTSAAPGKVTSFTVEEGSQLTSLEINALKGVMATTKTAVLDLSNATKLSSVGNDAISSKVPGTIILPGNITTWGTGLTDPTKLTTQYTDNPVFGQTTTLINVTVLPKAEGAELGTADLDYLFTAQKALTTVTLPEGMTRVGRGAFGSCASITNLKLPSTVTEIAPYAFYGGTTATSSSLGNKLEKLTSLELPAGLTTIGDYAFVRTYITNFTYPAGVTEISDFAFYGSTALAGVSFAEGSAITTVGESAFQNCTAFAAFTVPASVTVIGANAFNGCTALTLALAQGIEIEEIGADAFVNVGTLELMEDEAGFVYLGKTLYDYVGTASELVIPAKFNTIAKSVFENNTTVKKVSFEGDSITLEDNAFLGSSIQEVILPENGVLGLSVFAECKDLKSVTIPDGWAAIPEFTFAKSGLESVIISENAALEEIGNLAFYDAASLKSVTVPKALKRIGIAAFAFTSLESINWTKDMIPNLALIDDSAFAGIDFTGDVFIESGYAEGDFQLGNGSGSSATAKTNLKNNIESDYTKRAISTSKRGIFQWATLGNVTISAPNATGLNMMGGYSFGYVKAIAGKEFTVTFIVKDAESNFAASGGNFFRYSEVSAINFPAQAVLLKKLGTEAFSNTTKLKELYIPAYLADLSGTGFKGTATAKNSIEKIVIGDGVNKLPLPSSTYKWATGIFAHSNLKELIINQPADDAIINLPTNTTVSSTSNPFGYFAEGLTVIVNAALYDQYMANTYWAKHVANGIKLVAAANA